MAYSPKLAAKIAAMSRRDRAELNRSLKELDRIIEANPVLKAKAEKARKSAKPAQTPLNSGRGYRTR